MSNLDNQNHQNNLETYNNNHKDSLRIPKLTPEQWLILTLLLLLGMFIGLAFKYSALASNYNQLVEIANNCTPKTGWWL
jgi:hypothetical protein